MSTVNGLISAGVSSVTGTSTVDSRATEKLEELEAELQQVNADTTLTDDEKTKKIQSINNEIAQINASSSSVASLSEDSTLMSSMLAENEDSSDFSFFFGSGYTMSNVKSLYQASQTIQNEARTLSSEIAIDKARGVDTTSKQEKLTNLTDNVTILNDNLKSQIETALADEEADEETISVIEKIKASLEAAKTTSDEETETVEE